MALFLVAIIFILGWWSRNQDNLWGLSFALFIFLVIPQLDRKLKSPFKQKESSRLNRILEVLTFAGVIFLFVDIYYVTKIDRLSYLQLIYLIISSFVLLGGIGITLSHEFIHRRSKIYQYMGLLMLSFVRFMHYKTEHLFIHHKDVATPEDPSTAPINQSVYSFIPKHYWRGLIGSYKFEKQRLERQKKSNLRNPLHLYFLIHLTVFASIAYFNSLFAAGVWYLCSWLSFTILSVVEYLEHYGLERKKLESGRYERVHAGLSWDTNYNLTNKALFNLGFHSKHHMNASLKYDQLSAEEQAQKHPFGLITMVGLSLIPSLFFKIMNPRIK